MRDNFNFIDDEFLSHAEARKQDRFLRRLEKVAMKNDEKHQYSKPKTLKPVSKWKFNSQEDFDLSY